MALLCPTLLSALLATLSLPPEAGKAPEPPPAAREEAERLVKDLYKEDYARKAPAERKALAGKLLQKGLESRADAAAAYVLLCEARDLAVQTGQAAIAIRALKELVAIFAVDAAALRKVLVEALARTAQAPGDAAALSECALEAAAEGVSADDYAAARKMAEAAAAAAKRAKEPALASWAGDYLEQVAAMQRKFDALKGPLQTMKSAPKDSAANLAAGRYFCLVKGDWQRGLPHLAQGSDPTLFSLARKELAATGGPLLEVELGDGWWAAAEGVSPAEKAPMRQRAAWWYARAASRLSGLTKAKVLERLEAFAAECESVPRPGLTLPSGLVVAKFNGRDLRGWRALSGLWRVASGNLATTGGGNNRYLSSAFEASWLRVEFEFMGGNPGLVFAESLEAANNTGINLDALARNNPQIRRPVDPAKWNTVEVESDGSSLKFHLNGVEVHTCSMSMPCYLRVKAQRGELNVRKLVAIGYNP